MDQPATKLRTYPHGVPCWIDIEPADPDAAAAFYGGLFGWTFQNAMPPGAPGFYLIATLDGQDAAAIGPVLEAAADNPAWNTYIAVDDADATAAAVAAAGGTVTQAPQDAGPGGRSASCEDPDGAAFRLWQARRRLGAQVVNTPGAWNFSNLHTADRDAALPFYSQVFGWEAQLPEDGSGAMVRVPGYGDHLAATVDPGIRERHATAPPGFSDAIGGLDVAADGEPSNWQVFFTVAERDESAALVQQLGGTVLSTAETMWTRNALVRDPQGAEFTISQFTPPS